MTGVKTRYYGSRCRKCESLLTVENTYPSKARKGDRICKSCHLIEQRKFYKRSPYHLAWENILRRLGRKCSRCRISDRRVLQIDHIHGGGNKHRRTSGGNKRMWREVAKLSDRELKENYQILCFNCNQILAHERGEFSKVLRGSIPRA